MKSILLMVPSLFLFLLFSNCKDDGLDPDYFTLLDDLPTDKYENFDPLDTIQPALYGAWEVIGTSGGFAGNGYPKDFDILLAKPNVIFGIVRNDSLLTAGKMEIQDVAGYDLVIHFVRDTNLPRPDIELMFDSQKFIQIQGDTLLLGGLCCDRFDTMLKRKR